MQIRHILVAVSAAAIIAGTSYGALANGASYGKASSSSGVLSVGVANAWGTPVAFTIQGQHNESEAGGYGEASATAGTSGGALAVQASWGGGGVQGAAAWGSTNGSSCAGNC